MKKIYALLFALITLLLSSCNTEEAFLHDAQYISDNEILCLYEIFEGVNNKAYDSFVQTQFLKLYNEATGKSKKILIKDDLGGVLPVGIINAGTVAYAYEGKKVAVYDKEKGRIANIVSIADDHISNEPISAEGNIIFTDADGIVATSLQDVNTYKIYKHSKKDTFFDYAKWSYDSSKISYLIYANSAGGKGPTILQAIGIMDKDGNVVYEQHLEENTLLNDCKWARDSLQLAYTAGNEQESSLYILDAQKRKSEVIKKPKGDLDSFESLEVIDFCNNIILLKEYYVEQDENFNLTQYRPLLIYNMETDTLKYITTKDYYATTGAFSKDASRVVVCHQNVNGDMEIIELII